MDILDKLKSQIGDDVQHIFDHEALFKSARDEITALRARLDAVTEERNVQNDLRQIAEDAADDFRARAERAEAALLGPIKPITQDDMANIIAHLSPDLEPAGPLPNRNSVMMALIEVKNAHKAALATARRDAGLLNRIVLPMVEQRSREQHDAWDQAAAAIRALANEAPE